LHSIVNIDDGSICL
jgi:hypothetical protein